MKRFSIIVLASLAAFVASAGWVATPLDVTVDTPVLPVLLATTGTVTVIAAPDSGTSYFLSSVATGALLPLPALTHTVATTGAVTAVASPPAGESYALNLIATDAMLPANPTNSVTVDIDGVLYGMTNTTRSIAAAVTVTNGSTIQVTLSATVTNLPTLTFYRVWNPDTNIVTVTIIQDSGATTNSYALTNGTPVASAGLFVVPGDSITATRSGSVTNLPTLTMHRIESPAVATRLITGNGHWNLYGARLASAVSPGGPDTSVAVSLQYAGGATASYASFTNGAAGITSDVPLRLLPLDTVVVTVSGATNSPTVRVLREAWQD